MNTEAEKAIAAKMPEFEVDGNLGYDMSDVDYWAENTNRKLALALAVVEIAQKMARQYLICFDLGPIDHEEWQKYHHLADEMKLALDAWEAAQ